MADFIKCAEMTLRYEGVSSDANATDSSKYGITIDLIKKTGDMDTFDKNGDGKITAKDIQKLDFDDAIMAYKNIYWDRWDLGTLDDQKAALIFDAAMNHGHKIAAKIIQRALIDLGFDDVIADGIYGPHTREAIAEASTELFISKYFEYRKAYYNALVSAYPDQEINLPLWEERLDALHDSISQM